MTKHSLNDNRICIFWFWCRERTQISQKKKKNHLVDMLKYRPASYSKKVHFETGTVILWKVKNKQGL